LKGLHIAILAGVAIAAAGLGFLAYGNQPEPTAYSSGNFTATVVQDSASRFLARVQNNGPTLEPAGAFVVKRTLNENCEPQGIVAANFQGVRDGQRLVPRPDSLESGASVDIDSRNANLNIIPTGPDVETSIYIMKLEPNSIRATELVERIDIQKAGTGELERFEDCLQESGKGYPLLLLMSGPDPGSKVYFTVTDSAGNSYETALEASQDGEAPDELYWPPSRTGWLAANFTQGSGPAPSWSEPETLTLKVSVVQGGQVQEFEQSVSLSEPRESEIDFVEVAKGNAVPVYPKFWELRVDLQGMSVSP
jgi:hypothetical protein